MNYYDKQKTLSAISADAMYLFAGQALAADARKTGTEQTSETSLQGPQRSSQIQGASLVNPEGKKLGKIEGLIIADDGKVRFAILSHGGLLGIGNKLVPIPRKSLKPGKDEETLTVNITKDNVEKAPNFDLQECPNFTDPEWQKRVDVYYELPASATAR